MPKKMGYGKKKDKPRGPGVLAKKSRGTGITKQATNQKKTARRKKG